MADRNSWIHNICRFLTYCRRAMAGGIVSSQYFGENSVHFQELPERVVGFTNNREMPHKCRLFLGFVNILAVAIVVGLAMEGTSPEGPQLQHQEDDNDQADWSTVKEGDHKAHDIPKLPVKDSQLPSIKEDIQKPEASKAQERPESSSTASEQYSSVCDFCTASAKKAIRLLTEFGYAREEHTVRSKRCRCCGGVQTSNEATGDRVNLESVHTTTGGDLEGATPGAAQGESIGCSRDAQGEDQRHLVQTQETIYWRKRVLDILAPSLQPLPDLFNEFANMNESGHHTGGNVVEGDQSHNECGGLEEENAHESSCRFHDVENNEAATAQSHYEGGVSEENAHESSRRFRDVENTEAETAQSHYECGGSEEENAHERSCRFHDVENNEAKIAQSRYEGGGSEENAQERSCRFLDVENNEAATDSVYNLETILENEGNDDTIQRATAGIHGTDPSYDESLTKQQNSLQIRVEIQLPAPNISSQPSDDNAEYPEAATVLPSRPDTPPRADRHDSHSTSPMHHHSRSLVVIYTPISAPTETNQPEFSIAPRPEYYDARPEFSNASLPEYYVNNRDANFSGGFSGGGNTSSGPPQYSSSDDEEIRSQPSSSLSSRSWSTPVPSGRPLLHTSSFASRERIRPRGRALARRPRCGLRMMKALRDDPTCIPEEGKKARQPGREDKLFRPRTGDVICRHTVVPGRGAVEIYLPGVEQHLQDGDTVVRLKMDNKSYPTMLILSAKAHLFLQGRWIYLGRHQHGVRKPKKERLTGLV